MRAVAALLVEAGLEATYSRWDVKVLLLKRQYLLSLDNSEIIVFAVEQTGLHFFVGRVDLASPNSIDDLVAIMKEQYGFR